MKISEACDRLEAARPNETYCIDVSVWKQGKARRRAPEWTIWIGSTETVYKGPTLANVLEQVAPTEDPDWEDTIWLDGQALQDLQLEADRFHGRA